jgi:hypothetical protein
MAGKRERKSFASGLWETAEPVMCFSDGGGVCVCGRVIVRVRGRERLVRRKEWVRSVWWIGGGWVQSKISSKKIYKNTPNLRIKFRGVTFTASLILFFSIDTSLIYHK